MISKTSFYTPTWGADESLVGVLQSTRQGGHSQGVYRSLNVGLHVGDEESLVLANRAVLNNQLPRPACYVNQVHGTHIHGVTQYSEQLRIEADGLFTRLAKQPLAIMTADCLPLLLASQDGAEVAALHCGWRSLVGGIIERALPLFNTPAKDIHAWLGPAIGPSAFAVGNEVKSQFCAHSGDYQQGFTAHGDKFLANLPLLAELALNRAGVSNVTKAQACTYTLADTYFSYRRDGQTGRMASVIWRK